jgi:hypothetical protein
MTAITTVPIGMKVHIAKQPVAESGECARFASTKSNNAGMPEVACLRV